MSTINAGRHRDRIRRFIRAINQPARPSRIWVVLLVSALGAVGNIRRDRRIDQLERELEQLKAHTLPPRSAMPPRPGTRR